MLIVADMAPAYPSRSREQPEGQNVVFTGVWLSAVLCTVKVKADLDPYYEVRGESESRPVPSPVLYGNYALKTVPAMDLVRS